MKHVLKNFIPLLIIALVFITFGCFGPDPQPDEKGMRPIVFVHGLAGSADQFETQALRFASNGYPDNYFRGFEHNTISINDDREARLDAMIDEVLAATGADKVDLAGHSMGTMVSQNYLSEESQAAKVAHYINIDGQGGDLPGGVPTLNIMATSTSEITDATNVTLSQTHVQAASSAEAFDYMYRFLIGEAPMTTEVLPSEAAAIELKGRLVTFLTNVVPEGIDLAIYEVNPANGQRLSGSPDYTVSIGADGNFDFTGAKRGSSYEFHITGESGANGHYYYEPFVRTDTLIRLKYTEPGSLIDDMLDKSVNHVNLVLVRNKEMQGDGTDSVKINGTEVCDGILAGGTGINESGPIGLFVFDDGTDGVSDLSGVTSAFSGLPFVNGVDLVIPASMSWDGIISIVVKGRGSSATQTINTPNWESTTHKVVAQFAPM